MSDRQRAAPQPSGRVELVVAPAAPALTTGALAVARVRRSSTRSRRSRTRPSSSGSRSGWRSSPSPLLFSLSPGGSSPAEEAVERLSPRRASGGRAAARKHRGPRAASASPGGAWSRASAGIAGAALAAAFVAPVISLGPVFDLGQFIADTVAPRPAARRGRRASAPPRRLQEADFYTAYPEGAEREQLAAPLSSSGLPVTAHPPPARQARLGTRRRSSRTRRSAPTPAARSRSTARRPSRPSSPARRSSALATTRRFDPATGGTVLFGPAGRPLPQLPLELGPGGVASRSRHLQRPGRARPGGAFARGRPR